MIFYRSWVTRLGSCSVDILPCLPLCPGGPLQACFWMMAWMTFHRSWLTTPGHVLSIFCLACRFAKLILSRPAFGDGLDDFLQAGPCSVDVLSCLQLCQGGPLQAFFWRWFGRLFTGRQAMFCRCFGLRAACQSGLSRHAFGDGLDDSLQVLGDHAEPCSVEVLACLQLCQGDPLQACF